MARLEDIIREIADPKLRSQLAAEVAKLKARKTFGLVFEEHLPEIVLLPGMALKPGLRVAKRDDPTPGLFVIRSLNGRQAKIVAERGGSEEAVPRADLIAVKQFGEPIYPALVPVDRVTRAPGKPYHTVINADNFHALQLLLYCYEGRVDVIYIDPPYNSGARDWKYNNDYVDKSDQYRHSKWLAMMKRRLVLAKRLLKRDGVLIVTIDENEVGHLSVLLEAVFPEYLRHMVTAVINPKGTGKLNFARVDEYLFFCVPNNGTSLIHGIPISSGLTGTPGAGALLYPSSPQPLLEGIGGGENEASEDEDEEASSEEEEDDGDATGVSGEELPFPAEEIDEWELRHARRRGSESSYRHQRPNQFYPIFIDVKARRVVRVGEALPLKRKPSFAKSTGLVPVWPIDSEGNDRCWRFISPKMQELIDARRVRLGKYNEGHGTWTVNYWVKKPESAKLKTVWWKKAHDAGTHGTTLLHNMLGRRAAFPFPKSIYAVADALASVIRLRSDALILDFFAGSGTTLQSTCMLNSAYGGSRRCILVTNNEVDAKLAARLKKRGINPGSTEYEKEGICASVTWPRVKAALAGRRPDRSKLPGSYLNGRRMDLGFEENAEYMKLEFLDPAAVKRGESYEAILPILWLMAGAMGELELTKGSGRYHFPQESPFCVLLREDHFREFAFKLVERTDITHAFLVTDSVEAFYEMAGQIAKRIRCVQLYKSYLDNFKINLDGTHAD